MYLVVLLIILLVVHYLSSRRRSRKLSSPPRRSVNCSVLDRPSNVSPLSSGVNALKISTRSIHASRKLAGSDAWKKTDGDTRGMLPIQHPGDWAPVEQADPTWPAWDQESLVSPGLRSANTSQENLATGQPLLTPRHLSNQDSFASDMSADSSHRNSIASQQYNTSLERANQQFAQQNQHAPDPFMDQGRTSLSGCPYSQYSAASRSSVESIAMIVDEK